MLMIEQENRAFKGPDVVWFLEHALCQIPGKLLVIWEGSLRDPRSKAVKRFLGEGAAKNGCPLEQLPGYAPELNPDEGVYGST